MAGAAISIFFFFCCNKSFVETNTCLSRQARVCLVATKITYLSRRVCRAKHTFVAPKDVFCRNKHVFVATKMILVAVPANDHLLPPVRSLLDESYPPPTPKKAHTAHTKSWPLHYLREYHTWRHIMTVECLMDVTQLPVIGSETIRGNNLYPPDRRKWRSRFEGRMAERWRPGQTQSRRDRPSDPLQPDTWRQTNYPRLLPLGDGSGTSSDSQGSGTLWGRAAKNSLCVLRQAPERAVSYTHLTLPTRSTV